MLQQSSIQLLRFPFSFLLMPVFIFGISQATSIQPYRTLLMFLILHLLVYPSSNGYNSYMDRDTGPVGGLEQPLQPTRQLYYLSVLMDISAVLLALFLGVMTAVIVLIYILASRAYSYRRIRIKQYPIAGFLTVIFFQGAACFYLAYTAAMNQSALLPPVLPMLASSLLIGSLYPLTQIYQHEADRRDGVTTLSMLLGYRGTFIFSGILFLTAMVILYVYFFQLAAGRHFIYLAVALLPVTIYFFYWARLVWLNTSNADFSHTMKMNLLTAVCMNLAFLLLLIFPA